MRRAESAALCKSMPKSASLPLVLPHVRDMQKHVPPAVRPATFGTEAKHAGSGRHSSASSVEADDFFAGRSNIAEFDAVRPGRFIC
jgi:hypothetical protein